MINKKPTQRGIVLSTGIEPGFTGASPFARHFVILKTDGKMNVVYLPYIYVNKLEKLLGTEIEIVDITSDEAPKMFKGHQVREYEVTIL